MQSIENDLIYEVTQSLVMRNKKVKKCKNSWEDRNERAENLNLNQICGNFKLLNDPVQGEASVFASDPSKVENSSVDRPEEAV